MHAHLNIPDAHLAAVSLSLNTLLADEQILYTKTKYYHWNLESEHFHAMHAFFDAQAEQLEAIIDQTAERVRALGHYAVGSLKDFLALTRLLETKDDGGELAGMVQHLLGDHETLIAQLRKDIAQTAGYGDAGTSDFLTDLLKTHEKMAWMLRAHLPKEMRTGKAPQRTVGAHPVANPALIGM